LEDFASQFTSLEADKIRLQKEVESTSSKLDNAVKVVSEACENANSLKEELKKLKSKLKDEEALRVATEAQRNEKDNLFHQSTLALLSSPH
jgi:peptidoglycan hydrolase CwlO-like protein